ncbi:MAG: maleylpyruvate isomerase family mycothiol-dependent enzyme [Nocardioidaceae bacterium]
MSRPDLAVTREWVRAGTEFFLREAAVDLGRPSVLPGWTGAHLAAHVARNAEALGRLATWARTGIETPMYESPARRDEEIEESSHRSSSALRAEVESTAADLEKALDLLDGPALASEVRSARGRLIPATEIPWLRVREVWLHAVDLGASIDDLPADLVDALLDDVTESFTGRAPALLLRPADRDRTWQIPGDDDPRPVDGTAAALLSWLTGRAVGKDLDADGPLPDLPHWL